MKLELKIFIRLITFLPQSEGVALDRSIVILFSALLSFSGRSQKEEKSLPISSPE